MSSINKERWVIALKMYHIDFLKQQRKNKLILIHLKTYDTYTHTHEIVSFSLLGASRETKESSSLLLVNDNPCTFEKTEPPQNQEAPGAVKSRVR